MENVLDDLLGDMDLPRASVSTIMLADAAHASNRELAAGTMQSQGPEGAEQGSSAAWQATAGPHKLAPAPAQSSPTAGPPGQQHAGAQPDDLKPAMLTGMLSSTQPPDCAQHPELCAGALAEERSHPAPAARPRGRLRLTLSAYESRSAPSGVEPTRLQATLAAITQQLSALEESLQSAAPPARPCMSQIFPATQQQQALPQAPASSTPEDGKLGDSVDPTAGQHRRANPRRGSEVGLPSQAGTQADSRTPLVEAGSDVVGDRQLQEQARDTDLQQTAPVSACHGTAGGQAMELHQENGSLWPQPPRAGPEQGGAAKGRFHRQCFRGSSLRGSMPALGSWRRPQGVALDEHQPEVRECQETEEL